MKITIIVPGKFHAFYLAKGLQKKNVLEKIITSYPKFLLLREHIQNKLIISIFIKEIIERLLLRLRLINLLTKLNFFINYLFEYISSYKVDYKKINILVSWSGVAEKSFQKANIKNKKIIKILERGSSHIVFQNNILLEK